MVCVFLFPMHAYPHTVCVETVDVCAESLRRELAPERAGMRHSGWSSLNGHEQGRGRSGARHCIHELQGQGAVGRARLFWSMGVSTAAPTSAALTFLGPSLLCGSETLTVTRKSRIIHKDDRPRKPFKHTLLLLVSSFDMKEFRHEVIVRGEFN